MAALSLNDHRADKASPVKNHSNKQVTFAPNPVTIPPAETITAVSGDTSLSTANVKGTIQVTDTTDPSRIKNVLVSVPSGASTPTPDHTYAKSIRNKEGRDTTSSSDDSSDSEMDTTSDDVKTLLTPNPPVLIPSCSTPVAPMTQATPTVNATSKVSQNLPLVRRRGRPRKDNSISRSAPTTPVGNKSPRSILKVKPTPLSEIKEGITSKVRRRGRGCGTCIGCIRDDCGKCSYCLDKPKYGGPGRKKQRCALRICSQFKSAPGVKNSIHTPHAATLATVIGTVTTSEPVTVASPISTKTTSISAETHTVPLEPPKIVLTASKSKSTPSVSTVTATTSSTAMGTSSSSANTTTTSSTPGRSKQVERSVSLCILTSLCLLEHFHKLQQGGVSDMGTMKCVMCTRQRKRNLAKSDKFCTLRCMTMWQESNPGKSPNDAVPMDNTSLPYMPPTTLIDQTLPPAIKRLQIDMALPGSICQPSNVTTTTTTAPPLTEAMITSISNNITEILNSSSGSNGIKRTNKEQPTIPSKRVKETTGLAVSTSSKPAPTTTTITTTTKTTVKPITKRKGSDLSVDVKSWNVTDVVKYFESVPDCQYFASTLQEQEVDGQALLLLTSDSLVKCLGMKLGPALKIMIHVDKLKQQQMTQT